jgi:hypothetical protein
MRKSNRPTPNLRKHTTNLGSRRNRNSFLTHTSRLIFRISSSLITSMIEAICISPRGRIELSLALLRCDISLCRHNELASLHRALLRWRNTGIVRLPTLVTLIRFIIFPIPFVQRWRTRCWGAISQL